MPKKNEHADLIVAFCKWMWTTGRVSPSTAANYAGTVSAAIHKHTLGWNDEEGLQQYVVLLAASHPHQARAFSAGWTLFRAYMKEVQRLDLVALPLPSQVHVGPPRTAVYDLRAAVHQLTLGEFRDLQWGCVSRAGDAVRLSLLRTNGRMLSVDLSPRATAALDELRRWAWPEGVPGRGARLLPDAPNSEMPIAIHTLSRLLRTEKLARSSPTLLPQAPGGASFADTLPGVAPAPIVDEAARFAEHMRKFHGDNEPAIEPGRPVFGPGSVTALQSNVMPPSGPATATSNEVPSDDVFTVPDPFDS